MEKRWFTHAGGQQSGPYTPDELKARIQQGQLGLKDHAWCDGMDTWKRLEDLPDLKALFAAPTPPTFVPQPPTLPTLSTPFAAPVAPAHMASPAAAPQQAFHPDDLSVFIEIRPEEDPDDHHGGTNTALLKTAKKEAAQAEKLASKAAQRPEAVMGKARPGGGRRTLKWLILALIAVTAIVGALAAGYRLGVIPGGSLPPALEKALKGSEGASQ